MKPTFTSADIALLGEWYWELLDRCDRGPEGIEVHISPKLELLDDLMCRLAEVVDES